MTSTICAVAGPARYQKRRRLLAAALVGRSQLVRCPLAFFEWDIRMGETDPDEEGHHARDGLELADLDVVVGRSGPGSDQQLLHALVRDDAHDPDPVITRAFLVCRLLAQDFSAIAAFHEFAES